MIIKKETLLGALMVITAGACWGMTGTVRAIIAPAEASSLTVGSARVFASGSILFLYSFFFRRKSVFHKGWNFKGILLSAFGLTAYQFAFFPAVLLTGVGIGSLVGLGAAPIMAGFSGFLFFKEKLTPRWYTATCLAIAGCVLLVTSGGSDELGHVNIFGIFLALCAGMSYACQGIGLRIIGPRDPIETVSWINMFSGLMALPCLIMGDISWLAKPAGIFCVFMLSVVSTILPSVLFAKGILNLTLGKAYTLSLSEPLTAWFLSAVFLGERLSPAGFLGVSLLLLGIIILTLEKTSEDNSV